MMTWTTQERLEEATRFLSFIAAPLAIRELRVDTGTSGFISGRYSSPTTMARHAVAMQAKYDHRAVYYSLNHLHPDARCGSSTINTMQRPASTGGAAKDRDMRGRLIYAVDIDTFREKGTAASSEQLGKARNLADQVLALMRTHVPHFPEPIRVNSGNGIHLLWRGDGCDPDSAAWKFILRKLSEIKVPGAAVDASVFNPGRIMRLPGSLNRKAGDEKLVTVEMYPVEWKVVGHGEYIHRLAAALGFVLHDANATTSSKQMTGGTEGGAEDVMAFIAEYPDDLEFASLSEDDEKTRIIVRACPFVGRRHAQGNSAFLAYKDGTVRYKCFAESCPGRGMSHLIRFLSTKAGRQSQIFGPNAPLSDRELAAWGGVEEAYLIGEEKQFIEKTHLDEEERTMEKTEQSGVRMSPAVDISFIEAIRAQHPRTVPANIKAIDWSTCQLPLNPAAWGLTLDDLATTVRRMTVKELEAITDPLDRDELISRYMAMENDLPAMGKYLGYKWLATIAFNKTTRPAIDKNHIVSADELRAILEM